MTIDECRANIGSLVLYTGTERSQILRDRDLMYTGDVGLIVFVGTVGEWVHVRYVDSRTARATRASELDLLVSADECHRPDATQG